MAKQDRKYLKALKNYLQHKPTKELFEHNMVRKKLTKSQLVAQHIEGNILNNGFAPGTALPTVEKLGETFKASAPTIIAAFKILEEKGLILRSPGSGTYVKGQGDSADIKKEGINYDLPLLEPKISKAGAIANEIVENIINGNYKIGNFLPQQKALVINYRSSKETIAKALKLVEEKGLIQRHGSEHRVGLQSSPILPRSKNQLYILGDFIWYSQYVGHTNMEFLQTFDIELKKAGVTAIQFLDITKDTPKAISRVNKETALGFLHCDYYNEHTEEIMTLLSQVKLPVVWFNYFFQDISLISIPKNVFVLQFDNQKAGERVGAYLASLGHRSVAYLCNFNEPWSLERLKGLEIGLKKVFGPNVKIQAICENFIRVPKSISSSLSVKAVSDKLQHFICEIFKGYKFSQIDPLTQKPFGYSEKVDERPVFTSFMEIIRKDIRRRQMIPHFNNLLNKKDATAWVCSNEGLVATAVEYLKEQGVRVPDDLNIIGFDSNADCMLNRITVYNFMKSQMGYLAAHCLIGDIPIRRNRHGIVECAGDIIVGETTRKVS